MQYIRKLRMQFNLQAVKTKGLTLMIEHAPCCLLSIVGGLVGVSAFNHNPVLELGFALGGAVVGEYIGHKYFAKNCTHKSDFRTTAKRYGLSLAFGLASWGAHQAFLHDHTGEEKHAHGQQQHACDHDVKWDQNKPFFGSPALKQQIEMQHKQAHAHCH